MPEVIGLDRESFLYLRRAANSELRDHSNDRARHGLHDEGEWASTSHGMIYVANSTGAYRNRGEILALTTATTLTAENAFKTMVAPMRYDSLITGAAINLATSPEQTFRFCVLLEGCPNGIDGLALVSGFLPVKVNVTSTVHRYARPTTGDHTTLTSDWWGGAEFMQTVSGTGSQYVYCRIGNYNAPIYRGKTDASHAKSATGTVSVWTGIGGAKSDSTANIDSVYNPFANVATTKFVDVAWVDGGPELIAAEC